MCDQISFSLPETKRMMSKLVVQIEYSCRYSTRVKLGISLIVFVILTPTIRQLRYTLSAFRSLPQTDDISQYERRFTEVKQFLPPDQFVSYRDEFDKISEQCKAFYLAQYSLAPTVLVALDSRCSSSDEATALRSRFVLDNFHDPRREPYLLRLFSDTGVPPNKNPAPVGVGQLSGAEHMVLLNDFGLEVKLYSRGDK
jgi:hypothetical protein